jgi:hypothetical protein
MRRSLHCNTATGVSEVFDDGMKSLAIILILTLAQVVAPLTAEGAPMGERSSGVRG